MRHEGNGSALFSLVVSGKVQENLDQLALEAGASGTEAELQIALSKIFRELKTNPLQFGEPKYYLKHMKLVYCTASVAPLFVRYGVREDLKLVFLAEISWLSNPKK